MSDYLGTILLSGFLSSVTAACITLYFQRRTARLDRKLDCLRRVAAFRSVPPKKEWLEALNEICITFNGSEEVMNALAKFERDIRATGGHKNELLVDLIKAMMDDLKLSRVKFDEEFLLRPFGSKLAG
jgi:hypothetical protein